MTVHSKLAHLKPETLEILRRFPMVEEQILESISKPPLPANTLINTIQWFSDGLLVSAETDGVTTLDLTVSPDFKPETIELAINGELVLAQVGDEAILDRSQLIGPAFALRQNKRDLVFNV